MEAVTSHHGRQYVLSRKPIRLILKTATSYPEDSYVLYADLLQKTGCLTTTKTKFFLKNTTHYITFPSFFP